MPARTPHASRPESHGAAIENPSENAPHTPTYCTFRVSARFTSGLRITKKSFHAHINLYASLRMYLMTRSRHPPISCHKTTPQASRPRSQGAAVEDPSGNAHHSPTYHSGCAVSIRKHAKFKRKGIPLCTQELEED